MTPYLFQGGANGIYALIPAGSVNGQASYGDWHNVTTDPSGGNGNVYVADGATVANTVVWSQTIAVKPGSYYTFSFNAAEISSACCSNASLVPTINGLQGAALDATASWQQSNDFLWSSESSSTATITLVDANTSGSYNDFVLDDISFTGPSPVSAVPLPGSFIALGSALLGLTGVPRFRRRV